MGIKVHIKSLAEGLIRLARHDEMETYVDSKTGAIVSETAPESPKVGQIWEDLTTNMLATWDGLQWISDALIYEEYPPIFDGVIADMELVVGEAMTPYGLDQHYDLGDPVNEYSLQNAPVWMTISGRTIVGTPPSDAVVTGVTVIGTNSAGSNAGSISNAFSVTSAALSPVIVYDTFTGLNGTFLVDHAPDIDIVGGGWKDWFRSGASPEILNNVDIQLDKARLLYDNNGVIIDAGVSEALIDFEFTPEAGLNRISLLCRASGNSNSLQVNLREDNHDLWIEEVVNGSTTSRANTAFAFVEGTTYKIKTIVQGSSITVWIDDVEVLSYALFDVFETEIYYGFYRNSSSNATRIDNFKIETLP